jgi:tripartite-type tricarboxylate transporter receptor subunit TctC
MLCLKRSCLLLTVAFTTSQAVAQEQVNLYPSRAVTIVVPNAAGASFGRYARLYADKLSEGLGKPFIVDFKPGAGGTIAASFVAKAPSDGYVITLISPSFTIIPVQRKNLTYDPIKSFAPITLVSSAPYVLVVNPALPVKSVGEFVAYSRANPDKINFGTTGAGAFNHLAAAWLNVATNTKATYVHYKGGTALMTDLIAGRIQAGISSIPFVKPQVESGKIRAIGVTSLKRNPALPMLPSFAEQGAAGYDALNWIGFLAPSGTSSPIVHKLASEFGKALKAPEILSLLTRDGATPVGSTPEEFQGFLLEEMNRWKRVVSEGNIQLTPGK